MNSSLVVVGVGGLLLGGVGGFFAGGNSGASDSLSNDSSATKSNRAKVVAVESARNETIRNFAEIYDEASQTARVQKLLDYYANLGPGMFEDEAAKLDELSFSERILASYLLFSQWAEVDPLAALAHTNTMGRAGFFVKPTVLQGWASADPKGAAEYLKDNPREFTMMGMMGGRRGQGAAGTIATEWARQDPEAALARAKELEARDGSDAVANVIKQVAGDDPAAALQMANGLDAEAKQAAYESIALEWGRDDWNAMESWARGLPADQRDLVLVEGIEGYAQRNPEDAAAKLLTISEGEVRDNAFDNVIESWAQENPQGAMDFLLANGSEAAQEDAMREAMGPLTRTDPSAALDVINSLDDNAVRDRAVSTYVFSSGGEAEPQETIALAATIGDDDGRTRAVGIAAGRWFREDEAAANEYFENSDLVDAETLERIKSRANGEGGGRRGGRGRR